MFAFLPIIGPIIQGIVSIFTKKMDTTVQLNRISRENDLGEAQVSAQIIHDTQDDISLRLLRDIAIFFPIAWGSLIVWDKIVAIPFPSLVWGVLPLDTKTGLEWLPYAAYVFLLGNIGLNIWKRK